MSSKKDKKRAIKKKVLESRGIENKEASLGMMIIQVLTLLFLLGVGLFFVVMAWFFFILFI